jgi:hypothetical protein
MKSVRRRAKTAAPTPEKKTKAKAVGSNFIF